LPLNAVLPITDDRIFVLSILAVDKLLVCLSPFAVSLRVGLAQIGVVATAPEDFRDSAPLLLPTSPTTLLDPLLGGGQSPLLWNPFFVPGEVVPSVSQQAFQAKLFKLRPLYRLLHGNRTRLLEIVGPSKDISENSDLAHFVSQMLPRELKGIPALFLKGEL
jgi:hypothetical protein